MTANGYIVGIYTTFLLHTSIRLRSALSMLRGRSITRLGGKQLENFTAMFMIMITSTVATVIGAVWFGSQS